ncbi:hypothetical protein [Bradyrhizobium elkanii]|uniref:hypothetical protein n=1 Tax=Bradyrhizobium elkanii TaxID=29448 RepID=UPI003D19CD9A
MLILLILAVLCIAGPAAAQESCRVGDSTVQHGDSHIFYKKFYVVKPASCFDVAEAQRCENGQFVGGTANQVQCTEIDQPLPGPSDRQAENWLWGVASATIVSLLFTLLIVRPPSTWRRRKPTAKVIPLRVVERPVPEQSKATVGRPPEPRVMDQKARMRAAIYGEQAKPSTKPAPPPRQEQSTVPSPAPERRRGTITSSKTYEF